MSVVLIVVFLWFAVGITGAFIEGRGRDPMVAVFWVVCPLVPILAMLAKAISGAIFERVAERGE